MLWDTLGRLNQIARLRLKDVDLHNGSVLVMGKGRRERWMPIGDIARSVLQDYVLEGENVLPDTSEWPELERGKAVPTNGIYQPLVSPI